jgi:hypothetical protein
MSFENFAVAKFLLLAFFTVTLFSLVTLFLERPDTTIFSVVMEETESYVIFLQGATVQLRHRPPYC